MKLSCLMTVYNEAEFVSYAIRSCLPYVDHLVIVEGAYQECIKLGMSPRSTDGTIQIIHDVFSIDKSFNELSSEFTLNMPDGKTVEYIQANENSDKDQRNIGLQKIKDFESDWLLIIDGDEVYKKETFLLIKKLAERMDKNNQYVSYFESLTFVNNMKNYTKQKFPRLFKVTNNCKFVNDNYVEYDNLPLFGINVVENLNIKYYHYAFAKGTERFLQKRNWWMSRGLGKDFDYGWKVDKNGKISDKNHIIYQFDGNHPEIIKEHKKWKEVYEI